MNSAKQLQQIIPDHYLNRDAEDLVRYFEGCGLLLDQVQQSLWQRLADNFADDPVDGSLACQEWLIPYFAKLMDVRLVSPTPRGRRAEVANAITWRQSKGTLRTIESVAQAVGQFETVLHEGWRRVAVTPRIDTPLVSARSYGYGGDVPRQYPSLAARHPGLPAATVDLRCPAGAVDANPANPAVQQSTVDGDTHLWRQASLHGTPCHPGRYDDPSRRTVDFRTPDWRQGHHHPRNVLIHYAPPAGFFSPQVEGTIWPTAADAIDTLDWPLTSDPFSDQFHRLIDVIEEPGRTTFRNRSFGTEKFVPVRLRRVVTFGQGPGATAGDPETHTWRFEGIILDNRVTVRSGRIEFNECAVRQLRMFSVDAAIPVVVASNCLISSLSASRGRVQLEYCTVLSILRAQAIQASDCIFLERIRGRTGGPGAPPTAGCVRYSRIAPVQQQMHDALGGMSLKHTTTLSPVLFEDDFGERSCGVLHPATDEAIRYGADDGGEMGAFHRQRLALLPESVADKLRDFLPVGYTSVLVPDSTMLSMPD